MANATTLKRYRGFSGMLMTLWSRSMMVRGAFYAHRHVRPNVAATTTRSVVFRPTVDSNDRPANPETILSNDDLQQHVDTLYRWWTSGDKEHPQVVCLTGAGLSTEAGIPDYRGHKGSYHAGHQPMVHDQFMSSAAQRRRYWGRSLVGWRWVDERTPALGHVALTRLEQMGRLGVSFPYRPDALAHKDASLAPKTQGTLSIVTQNVDSLHRRAHSQHVLELHGRGDQLVCMQCGYRRDRHSFHQQLEQVNADWLAASTTESPVVVVPRPDGDADVPVDSWDGFHVPHCEQCGTGFFKPDVVFFGDSVPRHRVALVAAAIDACDALVVVGTSLAVHSAFRHVKAAHERGIPIAIVNVGPIRAEREGLSVLKVEAPVGPTLDALVRRFECDSLKRN